MGDDERTKQESPLSHEGWIMFLSGQITNLRTEGDKNYSVFFPVISLIVVVMAFITNSAFSTASANFPPDQKNNIILGIQITYILLSIFLTLFIVAMFYEIIKFHTITKKNAEMLEDIRNDIIDERLIGTNEIRERWRNVMQANYTEIYRLDFLNRRVSISKKGKEGNERFNFDSIGGKMKIDRRGWLSIFLIFIIVYFGYYFIVYNYILGFIGIIIIAVLLFINENQTIQKLTMQLQEGKLEIECGLKEHDSDLQEVVREIPQFRDDPNKTLEQLQKVFVLGFETAKGKSTTINNIKVYRDKNGAMVVQYDEV